MRKRRQEDGSFVPPREEFDAALRSWRKDNLGRAILREAEKGSIAIAAIRREPSFEAWLDRLPEALGKILDALYARYQILPGDVLNIVVLYEVLSRFYPQEEKAALRSLKEREKEARILDTAAAILEKWRFLRFHALDNIVLWSSAYTEAYTEDADLADRVRERAKALRQLGPSAAHRPKEVKLRDCGRALGGLFQARTDWPLHEYVGGILLAAFPGEWNPAGDIREAAKKLIKRKKPVEEKREKKATEENSSST